MDDTILPRLTCPVSRAYICRSVTLTGAGPVQVLSSAPVDEMVATPEEALRWMVRTMGVALPLLGTEAATFAERWATDGACFKESLRTLWSGSGEVELTLSTHGLVMNVSATRVTMLPIAPKRITRALDL